MPTRIGKEFSYILGSFLAKNLNRWLDKVFFQMNLKAQLPQCIKKGNDKIKYKPVSVLSNTSKFYEMFMQLHAFFISNTFFQLSLSAV